METHAQLRPPVEDISVVLSRFQAWTGLQSGSQTGARPSAKSKDGIRELSYEEAVSRKRSSGPAHTAPPIRKKKTAATAPPAPAVATKPEKTPQQKKHLKRKAHKKTQPSVYANQPAAAKPALLKPQTDFRASLAESVSMVPTQSAALCVVQPMTHRPLTLSIRISESEQALFKTRAEEQNLSVSAYLRQCALEAEHRRSSQLNLVGDNSQAAIIPCRQPGFFTRLSLIAQSIFH